MFGFSKKPTTYSTKFQEENTFELRKRLATQCLSKYPDRVPVIVEAINQKYREGYMNSINLIKHKYLVPADAHIFKFLLEIRRYIEDSHGDAIILYIITENQLHLPNTQSIMENLYSRYKQSDGFLYFYVCNENAFG